MFFKSTQKRRVAIWSATATILLGTGALLLRAFNPQPDPPKVFGIFGIMPADVIRLNVTNVSGAAGATPNVCSAQIGFVNADGSMLKTADVTIADGQSESVALSYQEAIGAPSTVAPRTRAEVRPVITSVPPGPCFTALSAEVGDVITGRTRIYATPQSIPAASPNISVNGQ
jgi:hypothetical protein